MKTTKTSTSVTVPLRVGFLSPMWVNTEDTSLMRKTAGEVSEPEGRKWQGFGSLLVAFKMLGLEHRGLIYSLC